MTFDLEAVDPDPEVECVLQRVRTAFGPLVILDGSGRPVPLRSVVRLAVGPLLGERRDAQTAAAVARALRPAQAAPTAPPPAAARPVWVRQVAGKPAPESVNALGWPG